MTSPIFPSQWAPQHPERIQLYSLATPNGQKIGIALEETGIPYEAHKINILKGEQFSEEYKRINPNSKIPSLIDPNGPNGQPITLMESGAILLYLARKTQQLLPTDPHQEWEAIQWLFFQMASIGPFFGQFGHFYKFARNKTTDEYGLNRYTQETQRLLGVLNTRLQGRQYLVADQFTIVDVATFPWVNALDFYGGKAHLDYDSYEWIQPWVDRCMARPAVQRGIKVCSFDS